MSDLEATLKGRLTIAPNAVCDEDKVVVDEVRDRNVVLVNRVAARQEVIKEAMDWCRNRDDVGALLNILTRNCD